MLDKIWMTAMVVTVLFCYVPAALKDIEVPDWIKGGIGGTLLLSITTVITTTLIKIWM